MNPLDVVERMASVNDWTFELLAKMRINILIKGKWNDYQVSFTLMDNLEALHLACAFDVKMAERRRGEVQQLIAHMNEQMWIGHLISGRTTAW